MTAFASIVLAALPGFGAKSGADGFAPTEGQDGAGQGPAGVFQALMASQSGGAATPVDPAGPSDAPASWLKATAFPPGLRGLADASATPLPGEVDSATPETLSAAETLAAAGTILVAPIPQVTTTAVATGSEPASAAPAGAASINFAAADPGATVQSTSPGLPTPTADGPAVVEPTVDAAPKSAPGAPVIAPATDSIAPDAAPAAAAAPAVGEASAEPPARPQPVVGAAPFAPEALTSLIGRTLDSARKPDVAAADQAVVDAASAGEQPAEAVVDTPVELALETALSPDAPASVEAAVVETPPVQTPASSRRPARVDAARAETASAPVDAAERELTASARADARPAVDFAPAALARPGTPVVAAPLADTAAEVEPATLDVTQAASTMQTAAELPVEAAPTRGSPETVARLAADIAQKLEGKTTRFDVQLDPLGLGKVDVSIEINADGRLTASLSFDSAQTAADLRSRAGELRQALEQAGFDLADGGLSFDMNNPGGSGGREARETLAAWSTRAFDTARTGLEQAEALAARSPWSRTPSGGVDIRI